MTTIVYSKEEGVICYDSRVSDNHSIISDNFEKKYVFDGATFVMSGCPADFDEFFMCYFNKSKPSRELSAHGFVVDEYGVAEVACYDCEISVERINQSRVCGSGSPFAMTALDMGATAKQAVKQAIKRDLRSGGRVRTLKINK